MHSYSNDTALDDNDYDHLTEAPAPIKDQLIGLGWRSRLVLVYILALNALIYWISDPILGAYFVATHLCVGVPLVRWWYRNSSACPLDVLVRSFGMGYIYMCLSVATVLVFAIAPVSTLIGDLYPILGVLTIVTSLVGVEELFKVLIARKMKTGLDMDRETRTHQIAYTSTSIGYASVTAALWLLFLGFMMEGTLADDIQGASTSTEVILQTVLLFLVLGFSVPLHVLSGYFIGLNTTRQLPFREIALRPFIIRAVFMLQMQLWLLVLPPFVAIAFIALSNAALSYAMVKQIKAVEAELPQEYLQRVGYLQAFGYGMLPGGEPDDLEMPAVTGTSRV